MCFANELLEIVFRGFIEKHCFNKIISKNIIYPRTRLIVPVIGFLKVKLTGAESKNSSSGPKGLKFFHDR